MSKRIERVNSLVRQELGKILQEYLQGKDFSLVTITRVDTSPDLSYVDVYLDILEASQKQKILDFLNRNIYHIQQRLNKKLIMKYVPQIRFKIDTSQEYVDEIEKLIKESKGNNQ